jgi:hypothetical protein
MNTRARHGWAIADGPIEALIFFTNSYAPPPMEKHPAWSPCVDRAQLWRTWQGAKAAADEWCIPAGSYRLLEMTVVLPEN